MAALVLMDAVAAQAARIGLCSLLPVVTAETLTIKAKKRKAEDVGGENMDSMNGTVAIDDAMDDAEVRRINTILLTGGRSARPQPMDAHCDKK